MVYDVVTYPRLPSKAARFLEGLRYRMFHYGEKEELLRFLEDTGARVFIDVGFVVDDKVLGHARGLWLVVARTSGLDYIDLEAAERRGICVANEPEAIAEAVAEHAIGLVLAVSKYIVAGHRYVASGEWAEKGWPRWMRGSIVYGKSLGLVGAGRIAALIAHRMRCLGVKKVYYWSRRRRPELELVLGARRLVLDDLFSSSDIVVVALPCTPETRNLIRYEHLARLPRGAILVNIGRGCVVDEAALARLLETREDIRVALDVFWQEPLPPKNPLVERYGSDPRVVLTPHIAGYSEESMIATAILAVMQAKLFLEKGCVWSPATKPCRQCTESPPSLDEVINLARSNT